MRYSKRIPFKLRYLGSKNAVLRIFLQTSENVGVVGVFVGVLVGVVIYFSKKPLGCFDQFQKAPMLDPPSPRGNCGLGDFKVNVTQPSCLCR